MTKDVSIKKILVPIDGSKYGEIAVAYASMLAKPAEHILNYYL